MIKINSGNRNEGGIKERTVKNTFWCLCSWSRGINPLWSILREFVTCSLALWQVLPSFFPPVFPSWSGKSYALWMLGLAAVEGLRAGTAARLSVRWQSDLQGFTQHGRTPVFLVSTAWLTQAWCWVTLFIAHDWGSEALKAPGHRPERGQLSPSLSRSDHSCI